MTDTHCSFEWANFKNVQICCKSLDMKQLQNWSIATSQLQCGHSNRSGIGVDRDLFSNVWLLQFGSLVLQLLLLVCSLWLATVFITSTSALNRTQIWWHTFYSKVIWKWVWTAATAAAMSLATPTTKIASNKQQLLAHKKATSLSGNMRRQAHRKHGLAAC